MVNKAWGWVSLAQGDVGKQTQVWTYFEFHWSIVLHINMWDFSSWSFKSFSWVLAYVDHKSKKKKKICQIFWKWSQFYLPGVIKSLKLYLLIGLLNLLLRVCSQKVILLKKFLKNKYPSIFSLHARLSRPTIGISVFHRSQEKNADAGESSNHWTWQQLRKKKRHSHL